MASQPSSQSERGYTGLTLMLFDQAGNAQASVDWQDAAERIVQALGGVTANPAWNYARAHRILQEMFDGDQLGGAHQAESHAIPIDAAAVERGARALAAMAMASGHGPSNVAMVREQAAAVLRAAGEAA